MSSSAPLPDLGTDGVELETERLVLRIPSPADAGLVADYFHRNHEHLAEWEPARPQGFYTPAFWEPRIELYLQEAREGRGMRLFIFPKPSGAKKSSARIIGTVGIANIVRGAFWCAHLGFGLDGASTGKGLMHEALRAVIAHAFGPVNLHRLEANHQPHNLASAKTLRRLGFVPQGFARDYLFIAGEWRDHVQTALLNPDWKPPSAERL